MKTNSTFCVYEHWRPDTEQCFYVGKGRHKRAHYMARHNDGNEHHSRIVEKLRRNGLQVVVRIICDGLTEEAAFHIEKKRIAFWRRFGTGLVNNTAGGEGTSGYKFTDEQRAKLSAALTGVQHPSRRGCHLTESHRKNISAAGKGHVVSEETRAKISAAQKGKPRPWQIGQKRSAEAIQKFRDRVFTEEHRANISAAKKGRPQTPEHKAALALAVLRRNSILEINHRC